MCCPEKPAVRTPTRRSLVNRQGGKGALCSTLFLSPECRCDFAFMFFSSWALRANLCVSIDSFCTSKLPTPPTKGGYQPPLPTP